MHSCTLLSFLAPLIGLAFLTVDALAAPTSSTSHHDPRNVSSSTTTTPSTTTGNGSIPLPSDYISTVLFQHNMHRANHSADPLIYSSALEAYAYSLTGTCDDFTEDTLYGKNTFTFYTSNTNDSSSETDQTARAISTWYNDELETYLAESIGMTAVPSSFAGILHFSQIVWKDTTEVGCSATMCQAGTAINPGNSFAVAWSVVCAYGPAGNCVGNACPYDGFIGNVGSPLGMEALGEKNWHS